MNGESDPLMGLPTGHIALQQTSAANGQEEKPAGDEQSPRGDQAGTNAAPGRRDVPLTSIVVEDPEEFDPVTPQTGVADVLLGSIALVGAILVAALVLGLAGGALRVYIVHTLGLGGPDADEADHIRLAIGRDTSDTGAAPSDSAPSAGTSSSSPSGDTP